jgi:hypothetical protein
MMELSDIFLGLGVENFRNLLGSISMGKLRSYQLFDRLKTRAHLTKLNAETLRRSAPRLWERMSEGNKEFATDVAQAVLVSNLDMIKAVLDHLRVPHEDGFFSKDADVSSFLTDGWQQSVYGQCSDAWPKPVLVFYLNHLAWEMDKASELFQPAP